MTIVKQPKFIRECHDATNCANCRTSPMWTPVHIQVKVPDLGLVDSTPRIGMLTLLMSTTIILLPATVKIMILMTTVMLVTATSAALGLRWLFLPTL